ncbi:hypothetical protein Tco_0426305 [Tanacetum coccineum]
MTLWFIIDDTFVCYGALGFHETLGRLVARNSYSWSGPARASCASGSDTGMLTPDVTVDESTSPCHVPLGAAGFCFTFRFLSESDVDEDSWYTFSDCVIIRLRRGSSIVESGEFDPRLTRINLISSSFLLDRLIRDMSQTCHSS